MMDNTQTDVRLVCTVEQAGRLLGISRTLAYELAGQGELPVLRSGRRIVVPRAALDALLAQAAVSPRTSARRAR
jgi:excisionase family DNA binding protein